MGCGIWSMHFVASIGVSIYPDDGADAQTLLQHADAAMYHAKKSGRNTYQFFAPAMNAFARERLELENGLRRALSRREFVLHYQPKLDVHSGRIDGAEALIRWRHPTRGLTMPLDFIPLAEEFGLIIPIGEWALREACRQAYAWQAAGMRPLRVAVNLSAQQFKQKSLVDVVADALRTARLEPRCDRRRGRDTGSAGLSAGPRLRAVPGISLQRSCPEQRVRCDGARTPG
jgi:diguanylate cyclase